MSILLISYGILGGLISALTVGFTGGGFLTVVYGYLSGAATCGLAVVTMMVLMAVLREGAERLAPAPA